MTDRLALRILSELELLEDRITPTISFGNVAGGMTKGSNAQAVAVGDLTGNGREDMVIGTYTGGLEIFLNNGAGQFKETGSVPESVLGEGPTNIALADMTDNGKIDLVVSSSFGNKLLIFLGNGNGTFQTKHPIIVTLNYAAQDMQVADLNGNGRQDVAIAIPGGAAVLLNNGTSSILNAPTYYNASNSPDEAQIVVGDFSGTGRPDLAISVFSQNLVEIYPNEGDGTFGAPTPYDTPNSMSPNYMVAGDFSGSGHLDLAVSYSGSADVGLMLGNGDGTFQAPTLLDTNVQGNYAGPPLAAADFDLDGKVDLVVAEPYEDLVFPGNGDGTFGAPVAVNSVDLTTGLAIVDLNGDGLPDIVSVSSDSPGQYAVAPDDSVPDTIGSFGVFESTPVTAGQPCSVTVTAKTATGVRMTNFVGNVDFSSSDGKAVLPSDAKFVAGDDGVAHFTVTFKTAGTQTLSVADALDTQATGSTLIAVNPGVVSGAKSAVDFTNTTNYSGQNDTVSIVATDANGNAITGLKSSAFAFKLSGGTSNGTFGPVTESSTPGTYTAEFTGITAGTPSALEVVVSGVALGSRPQVSVSPGIVNWENSQLEAASPTLAAGKSEEITFILKDAAGNKVTGLEFNDFSVSFDGGIGTSSGTGEEVAETKTPGTYVEELTGDSAGPASLLSALVEGVWLTDLQTITVKPGAISPIDSTARFAEPTVSAGSIDLLTVTVLDAEGNPITGLTKNEFMLKYGKGGSTVQLGAVTSTSTPGTYTAVVTGARAGSAGEVAVSIDGVKLYGDAAIQVVPGPVDAATSSMSISNSSVPFGDIDTVTLVLKDAAGNAVTGLSASDFVLSISGGTSDGAFDQVTETSKPGTYTTTFTALTIGTPSTILVAVEGLLLNQKAKLTVTE